MMIGPKTYISNHKNDTFLQLIEERGRLLNELHKIEMNLFNKITISEEKSYPINQEARYHVYLQYLAELCAFMSDKYYNDKVWQEDMSLLKHKLMTVSDSTADFIEYICKDCEYCRENNPDLCYKILDFLFDNPNVCSSKVLEVYSKLTEFDHSQEGNDTKEGAL